MLLSRFLFGVRVCSASVGVDDAHDVINVSSAEVPDAKVLKITKRAEVTLELEARCLIHPNDWFSSSITSWILSFEPYLLMASARLRSQNGQADTMASTPNASASFVLSPEISKAHSG